MSNFIKRINWDTEIGGANLRHFDYSKLDITKLTTKERLEVVNKLLEGNTYFEELMEKYFTNMEDNYRKFLFEDYEFALRLQAMTNYLLWAYEKENKSEERIYENQFQLDRKHYDVYSLDGFVESNGRDQMVTNINKSNYKKEKDLTFDQINKKQIIAKYEFLKDYYDLLDYIVKNNLKIKRNSIKDDIVYTAERHMIVFKDALKDSGCGMDLEDIEFTNADLVAQLLRTPVKEMYDLSNNLDVIQFDFNELYKMTNLTQTERIVIHYTREQYTQTQIADMLKIHQKQVSRIFNAVISKVISKYKFEKLKFTINKNKKSL